MKKQKRAKLNRLKLIEMIKKGYRIKAIAKELKRTASGVYWYCKKYNIDIKPNI